MFLLVGVLTEEGMRATPGVTDDVLFLDVGVDCMGGFSF